MNNNGKQVKKREGIFTFGNSSEKGRRSKLLKLLKNCPIPDEEMLLNLGLFLTPQAMSRILFMDFLYKQILDIQGVVLDFGCRWGQNMAIFSALRGIYEPYNRLRKLVAFDTFKGFPGISGKDGKKLLPGMYSVSSGYDKYLKTLLHHQEQESPMAHICKHEVIKGDASVKIGEYLAKNPETIVSLAYFDMDLYKPTADCLSIIKERLTVGSVIGFDELNDHLCPGETMAVKEVLGLNKYSFRRFPHNSRTSYVVYGRP